MIFLKLSDKVFVISRIIKVSERVISLSNRLHYLDITNSESNNCFSANKKRVRNLSVVVML